MSDGSVVAVVARATILRGYVDDATRERITGWALGGHGDAPAALQILDNGRPIASLLANGYRPDLQDQGIGSGWHGFDVAFPGGLSPLVRHVIQVRRQADGSELIGSPVVIEAADAFDEALEAAVARAVKGINGQSELERVLRFLATQTDQLLQQSADIDGQRSLRQWHHRQVRRGDSQGNAARPLRPRALIIDERLPARDRDGGSQVVLSHAKALQSLGYQVSLIAADQLTSPKWEDRETPGLTVYGSPFYSSVEDVLRRQLDCFDVVYLHRASIAGRYLTLVRQYQPRARLLYNVADLHHVRLERQAAVEERPELLTASRAFRLTECTAAWSADAVLTHSTEEARWLRRAVPEAAVHRVPWSVDIVAGQTEFHTRHGVAFIGNYAHAPNVDAARWLVEVIMPLVWDTDPAISCFLVGSDMPASLRELAGSRVHVMGYVPALSTILNQVRLTVAPLRFGAGVKAKVIQSLAAGVPCVMSPVAMEGIGPPPGLSALMGRDAAELAGLIASLHGDAGRYAAFVTAGQDFVRAGYNQVAVEQALLAAIEGRRPTHDA